MQQLDFHINNGHASETVYVPTTDPKVNQLVLVIGTNTSVTLVPSQPVEESGAADATGSLFYLNLKNLGLSASELTALQCGTDAWTSKVYPDEEVLCLTPL